MEFGGYGHPYSGEQRRAQMIEAKTDYQYIDLMMRPVYDHCSHNA
jgi:hypothetical protein